MEFKVGDIVKFVDSENIMGTLGKELKNPFLSRAGQIGKVLNIIPEKNALKLSLVENDGRKLISYIPASAVTKLSQEEISERGGMSPEFLRSIGMNPLTGEVESRGGGKRRKKYSKKKKKSKKKKGKSKRKRSKTRRRR